VPSLVDYTRQELEEEEPEEPEEEKKQSLGVC
jgi:hypothetical protein